MKNINLQEESTSMSLPKMIVPETPLSGIEPGTPLKAAKQKTQESEGSNFNTIDKTGELNKIVWQEPQKPYYTTISAPDLVLEEKLNIVQNRYSANAIYQWNIDGQSEYNILSVLQQMTMVSNAYKIQTRLSDPAIAHMLIAGFTGEIIWDENNEDIPDAVATLVFAISQHFVGDPSHLKDKNLELLSNLKCKRLSDFRQYKDTFLTRVAWKLCPIVRAAVHRLPVRAPSFFTVGLSRGRQVHNLAIDLGGSYSQRNCVRSFGGEPDIITIVGICLFCRERTAAPNLTLTTIALRSRVTLSIVL
ncbi:hypothetical protein CRG98_023850 [Punica granatum]|uniref:DUF7746 domain-containing protein n=1 Tax=Punica granatum TaxID=22663 RepID=A0A2I0JHL6_PUNGR|nr:hypothetical protein CRG98_023850 [Punica granatum]